MIDQQFWEGGLCSLTRAVLFILSSTLRLDRHVGFR